MPVAPEVVFQQYSNGSVIAKNTVLTSTKEKVWGEFHLVFRRKLIDKVLANLSARLDFAGQII